MKSEPTPKLAIIAALERELHPLIRTWRSHDQTIAGRTHRFYEHEAAVAVCGGIGPDPARRATEAAITLYHPTKIYSVGFAGALDKNLKTADIFTPARVVDTADGSTTTIAEAGPTLISFHSIATPEQKAKLAASYSAQAVDMEAAAVARAALLHNIPFAAIKAISDEADFQLPAMDRFTGAAGEFFTVSFMIHTAIRPWLWPTVVRLSVNSSKASRALCDELGELISQASIPGTHPLHALEVSNSK